MSQKASTLFGVVIDFGGLKQGHNGKAAFKCTSIYMYNKKGDNLCHELEQKQIRYWKMVFCALVLRWYVRMIFVRTFVTYCC